MLVGTNGYKMLTLAENASRKFSKPRYLVHSNLCIALQQPQGNLGQFVCHRNLPHGIILAAHALIPMLFSCRLS